MHAQHTSPELLPEHVTQPSWVHVTVSFVQEVVTSHFDHHWEKDKGIAVNIRRVESCMMHIGSLLEGLDTTFVLVTRCVLNRSEQQEEQANGDQTRTA